MRTDDVVLALGTSAYLVELYGERYLPIFLKMEATVAQLRETQDAMARARAVRARLRSEGLAAQLEVGGGRG